LGEIVMNKAAFIAPVLLVAATLAMPARAQGIIPDVIASTIANMNQGMPEWCLDGSREPNAQQAARFTAEAEPSLRAYLALASAGADLSPAFVSGGERHLAIDGAAQDVPTGRDPWAARVARLELVGLRLGAMRVRGRGLWRAFAADGTELGTYDGLFRRKSRGFAVSSLDLYSTGAVKQPAALGGFCYTPGDAEAFLEARAQREAERAARRAAREAERAARAAARQDRGRSGAIP
jgi:hypothetical protein